MGSAPWLSCRRRQKASRGRSTANAAAAARPSAEPRVVGRLGDFGWDTADATLTTGARELLAVAGVPPAPDSYRHLFPITGRKGVGSAAEGIYKAAAGLERQGGELVVRGAPQSVVGREAYCVGAGVDTHLAPGVGLLGKCPRPHRHSPDCIAKNTEVNVAASSHIACLTSRRSAPRRYLCTAGRMLRHTPRASEGAWRPLARMVTAKVGRGAGHAAIGAALQRHPPSERRVGRWSG